MAKFTRQMRRDRCRKLAQQTGIPMRHLWRAQQRARNVIQSGDFETNTQKWYNNMWAKVLGGILVAGIIVWMIITISVGKV